MWTAPRVSHTFSDSLSDGDAGVGVRDAISRFDDIQIQDLSTGGPTPGSLPLQEDFEDQTADHLQLRAGLAGISNGAYYVTPHAGMDSVTTLELNHSLPANVTWEATINAEPVSSGRLSNAFLIFDYVSPTNFKFAGAYVGINQWLMGHRNATEWVADAVVSAPINALSDYHIGVTLEATGDATLSVNGLTVLTYTFGDSLTDGALGLATKNALSTFDNLAAAEYIPPPITSLPFAEDFAETPEFLDLESGEWSLVSQRYEATPAVRGDAVATVRLDQLVDDFEILATINANGAAGGRLSNAFVIFDYQDGRDFKFAGAYAGTNQWLIGERDAGGWRTKSWIASPIDALADYELRVSVLADSEVTLYVDGVPRITHTFAGSIKDGGVGVGTRDAISRFDDLAVREIVPYTPPPTSIPHFEDFDDGVADHLLVRSGLTGVAGGRYQITPQLNGDGVSTLVLSDPPPTNVELTTTFNADGVSSGRLSNAMVIFDYVNATDFKFAGAYVGVNQWVIGHRDASGWVKDRFVSATIHALADYDLRVTLEGDGTATLFVGGVEQVSHAFGESLTDGDMGLGTWNALARFDHFAVKSYPKAALPFNESFDAGDPELFEVRRGQWSTENQVYETTPIMGQDGVSTMRLQTLPASFELEGVLNIDPAALGRLSNAFLIFDYHGPTDFNFAGAYAGTDQWLIGHRNLAGWQLDAILNDPIDALTDYDVRVRVTNATEVTLYVGDAPKLSYTYGDSLIDGDLGVGTRNAVSRFDNVAARSVSAPQTQLMEDFGLEALLRDHALIAWLAPYAAVAPTAAEHAGQPLPMESEFDHAHGGVQAVPLPLTALAPNRVLARSSILADQRERAFAERSDVPLRPANQLASSRLAALRAPSLRSRQASAQRHDEVLETWDLFDELGDPSGVAEAAQQQLACCEELPTNFRLHWACP